MSRPRANRLLGMTIPQWGTLGVIFLCICGIVTGGFWWLNQLVAAAYESPELAIPTVATPLPTQPPTPTGTPTPTASPTPITRESIIPSGWALFSASDGAELWLPPSYEAQTEEEKARSVLVLGDDEETVIPLLALKDTAPSQYLVVTTFQLTSQPNSGSDLDEIVDDKFGNLTRQGRLLESGTFSFATESYEARSLLFDINIGTTNAGLAIYVVRVDDTLYFLAFATTFNELYERLPDFDKAVQTFRVAEPSIAETPTP